METFEEILRKDLHHFLLSMKEVDERLPECPDVEDKWPAIILILSIQVSLFDVFINNLNK